MSEFETDDLTEVYRLVSDIKHKNISRSYEIAIQTEKLLEKLISEGQWKSAKELMSLVKKRMHYIKENLPQETTALNVMRHFLKIIRREYEDATKVKAEGQSLHQIVTANINILNYSESLIDLKSSLLGHLTEYKLELESSSDNIAAQAYDHIHMGEVILTVGMSHTVENFMKSAAKVRALNVIVVEAAPSYNGEKMAAKLRKSKIETTVIPDAAVFAMMSRVNKVIISTHTVLANGGLRAPCGIYAVALAAKHYSVPVMVLFHMYKLNPVYVGSHNHESFNVCGSPADVIPYSSGQILNKVKVSNPVFDYVPPELVTLFISYQGGNVSSYMYRLLSELYHQDDYDC